MSYEKVKSIRIDEKQGKVFINCACNNVRPLIYYTEEYPYFSKILQQKGRKAVEIALLKSYEEGGLQEGINKYSKALKVLFYVYREEYKKFNWRWNNFVYGSDEDKKYRDRRESEEFEDLLKKCLDFKISNKKWVITKEHFGVKVYGKRTKNYMKWVYDINKATKYDFEEETKNHIFKGFELIWKIEEVIKGGVKNEKY